MKRKQPALPRLDRQEKSIDDFLRFEKEAAADYLEYARLTGRSIPEAIQSMIDFLQENRYLDHPEGLAKLVEAHRAFYQEAPNLTKETVAEATEFRFELYRKMLAEGDVQ